MDAIKEAYLKKHRLPPFENWNEPVETPQTISNLQMVGDSLDAAREEIAAREQRDKAMNNPKPGIPSYGGATMGEAFGSFPRQWWGRKLSELLR